MNPPDPGLPLRVRIAMTIGQRLPRSALKLVLRASGRPSVGQLDDVRRISRPWGFDVEAVAQLVPIEVWHGERDAEVPVAPWQAHNAVSLKILAENLLRNRDGVTVIDSFVQGASAAFTRNFNLAAGSHPLTVSVTDTAGNTSTSSTATLTIDPNALEAGQRGQRWPHSLLALGRRSVRARLPCP